VEVVTDEPLVAACGGGSAKPSGDTAKEPEEPRGGKFVLKPPKVFNSYRTYCIVIWKLVSIAHRIFSFLDFVGI